ncbi:MAG: tetratricopeptide repeat protein [Deltaproteobacteria bacterium]|nr:tetratricopeptide repeat protein [Deltaproteobacteria bacterium]
MRQKVDRWIDELLDLLGVKDCPGETQEGEFYFDDEPIERILYGAALRGPSPANLFLPAWKNVRGILTACKEGNVTDIISAASELAGSDILFSGEMCYRISEAIGQFFPYYPNPVMKQDLSSLKALFEKIWRLTSEWQDVNLQHKTGTLLYRYYEYHRQYDEARQVLSRLIEISKDHNDRKDEALYMNNFGFEYLLEERWEEAIPYFEEAARIFQETNIAFEFLNARANYWLCRFELGNLDDVESIEMELKEILHGFKGSRRWYERKPLILLAKIEEKRGNIDKAIDLVKKSIKSAKDSNTRYPEIDTKYLNHLKKVSLVGCVDDGRHDRIVPSVSE